MHRLIPYYNKPFTNHHEQTDSAQLTHAILRHFEREPVQHVGFRSAAAVEREHLHHIVEPRSQTTEGKLRLICRHIRHQSLIPWLEHLVEATWECKGLIKGNYRCAVKNVGRKGNGFENRKKKDWK